MNEKKKQIWKLFLKKEKSINQIQDLILNYENEFPEDVDLYLMKMWFFSEENKVQQAIEIGEEALRKNPYLLEIHIKLAEAYECQSKYMNAYKHYCISKLLASYAGDKKVHNDCEQASKRAMERMEQLIAYLSEEQKTFLDRKSVV